MTNVVRFCGKCLTETVETAKEFVRSNGDTVLRDADSTKCIDVCHFLGSRAINGITKENRIAMGIIAGDDYGLHPVLVDGMGKSVVFGKVDGIVCAELLIGQPYPLTKE